MRPAIYLLGLMPAVATLYLALVDELGADPMRSLEQTLGQWALRFIVAGLAITPLRRLANLNLVRYRRAVGLLAFYYACLHLVVYALLDQGLDLAAIWQDVAKRPYITIGVLAFALLVPLAATSNNATVKRMGASAWQRLHRLVYPAALAAAVHFVMIVKAWPPEPLIYAALVSGLLLVRLFPGRSRRPLKRAVRGRQRGHATAPPPLGPAPC